MAQQLEKRTHIALLFDFYGSLLTQKQRRVLSLFYEEDYSLSEIAEDFCVSRQAAFDLIRRSENLLENYEARLGMLQKYDRDKQNLTELQALARLLHDGADDEVWQDFFRLLDRIKAGD